MAQKLKLRELGMDTMERLYYERKEIRQKAYTAKRKKSQKEQDSHNCGMILSKAI